MSRDGYKLSKQARRYLASCCRTPANRILARQMPAGHNWHPYRVTEPQSGMWFTDDAAWEFIATQLEEGVPVQQRPAGAEHAYPALEMIVEVTDNERRLYMKIGILTESNKVIGLSFHYSTEEYR